MNKSNKLLHPLNTTFGGYSIAVAFSLRLVLPGFVTVPESFSPPFPQVKKLFIPAILLLLAVRAYPRMYIPHRRLQLHPGREGDHPA